MTSDELIGCNRVVVGIDYVETTLVDGRKVFAFPLDDPESIERSYSLGYAGDIVAMTREHDPLHTRLCVALGFRESPALRNALLGHGLTDLGEAEECMVLAAQRFLNLCRRRGITGERIG